MGLIADAVNAIMREANKTSAADRLIAEQKVKSALEAINAQINLGVLKVAETFAVTSGTSRYVMPGVFGSMIEVGQYDATGDRIVEPGWVNIGEHQAIEQYGSLLSGAGAGDVVGWKLDVPTTGGNDRIRLYPTPDSSFTAQMIYFAALSDGNVDRMGWIDPLIDGAKRKMSDWFPAGPSGNGGFYKAEIDFANDIRILKASKKKTGRIMSPISPHPEVVRGNYWMRVVT